MGESKYFTRAKIFFPNTKYESGMVYLRKENIKKIQSDNYIN